MVKSKKMSKTGIAVIVLAILLVLSLVMGMTGAWYTKSAGPSTEGDYSFTLRDTWIELSASGAGTVTVSREVNGTRSNLEAPAANQQGVVAYTVMPGDYITASGSVTFTVTNTGLVGFYYVIVKDGAPFGATESTAAYVAAGEHAADAISVADTLDLVNTDNILVDASSPYTYQVSTALTYDNAGDTATISFGAYSIYAIQAENVGGAAGAFSILSSNWA